MQMHSQFLERPEGRVHYLEAGPGREPTVVLLHGDLVPQEYADALVERLPNARKVIIADAGHAPYMNDADAFHDAVLRFLRESTA